MNTTILARFQRELRAILDILAQFHDGVFDRRLMLTRSATLVSQLRALLEQLVWLFPVLSFLLKTVFTSLLNFVVLSPLALFCFFSERLSRGRASKDLNPRQAIDSHFIVSEIEA
jgi:hypothetical protein